MDLAALELCTLLGPSGRGIDCRLRQRVEQVVQQDWPRNRVTLSKINANLGDEIEDLLIGDVFGNGLLAEEMADLGYERARKVLESLRGSAS